MKPSTIVDPYERTPDELKTDKERLADLRSTYNFTPLTDQQQACLVYDSRMENHKPEGTRYTLCKIF